MLYRVWAQRKNSSTNICPNKNSCAYVLKHTDKHIAWCMVKISMLLFLTQDAVLMLRNLKQYKWFNTPDQHVVPTLTEHHHKYKPLGSYRMESENSPVYSAMDVDVMEEAVEPLSQSLSVVRLELRLRPGIDSTDSPLLMEETNSNIKVLWGSQSEYGQLILKRINKMQARICTQPVGHWKDLPMRSRPSWVDTVWFSGGHRGQWQTRARLGTDEILIWWGTWFHYFSFINVWSAIKHFCH